MLTDTREFSLTNRIKHAEKYISGVNPAIEGSGGSNTFFGVACSLVGYYSLPRDVAKDLLCSYNDTCQPPFDDYEIEHKLTDAIKKTANQPNCLDRVGSYTAAWQDQPKPDTRKPVPAPLAADDQEQVQRLADDLHLPVDAINAFNVTWNQSEKCWLMPERNAAGETVGLCRRFSNGEKKIVKDQKHGLYFRDNWQDGPGSVLIVEGLSDSAAAVAMGLSAIGRPHAIISNTGPVMADLVTLLGTLNPDRPIIVIAERDGDDGTDGAGTTGAKKCAKHLASKLPNPVSWGYCPDKAKDTRCWYIENNGDGLTFRDAIETVLIKPKPPEPETELLAAYGSVIEGGKSVELIVPRLTEAYDSMMFVNDNRGHLRWCGGWKTWLNWSGSSWRRDDSDSYLEFAKRTMLRLYVDAVESNDKEAIKWAHHHQSLNHYRSIAALAHHSCHIHHNDFDLSFDTLNCPNGEVDLKTGELLPHNREAFNTKICGTEYNQDAKCPTWERFLSEVFQADEHLIAFVQRWFGYCLTGSVVEQKMAIFWGDGSNGKSTLLGTIRGVLGEDYMLQASPDLLLQTKNGSNKAERAKLFRKRLAVCVETGKHSKFSEQIVKMLTGGDPISCEPKYENPWEFMPTHKLILCTNHKPTIEGTDFGIWRRLLLIPYQQQFEGVKVNPNLPEELMKEAEGILAWLVRGCLQWRQIGLNPPETVLAATNEYKTSEDTVGRFIAERCVTGPAFSSTLANLYSEAESWALDCGEEIPGRKDFAKSLRDRKFRDGKSSVTVFQGIMVRPREA